VEVYRRAAAEMERASEAVVERLLNPPDLEILLGHNGCEGDESQ